MIHGAQGDQTMFAGLAAGCAADFRVLTFDQRGSGLSEKPDIDYSIAMLADDTAALMDHLGLSARACHRGLDGRDDRAGVGAAPSGKGSLALVLGCTTPGGPKAIRAEGNALAAHTRSNRCRPRSAAGRSPQAVFSKGHLARHPEIIAAMIEARRGRPIDPIALGHRMKALSEHDTYDRLPKISCPTLVITGKDDALISWENSRLLAERIPGARLEILDPAGHCFWLERPQESRAAIVRFLEGASHCA